MSDIVYYNNLLKNSRKLQDDDEIDAFEIAIEKLCSAEKIDFLYDGFDDETEDEEVMFGLVHAIESYYINEKISKEEYFSIFIEKSKQIYKVAEEWVILLNIRILNDNESLKKYIQIAKEKDEGTKNFLIDIMHCILQEDEELFNQSVSKFITGIK